MVALSTMPQKSAVKTANGLTLVRTLLQSQYSSGSHEGCCTPWEQLKHLLYQTSALCSRIASQTSPCKAQLDNGMLSTASADVYAAISAGMPAVCLLTWCSDMSAGICLLAADHAMC